MNKFAQYFKKKEQSMVEFHDDRLKELSQEVIDKSVSYLKSILTDESKEQIIQEWKHNPETWWALAHHGWGTAIRNSLRDNVCLDKDLPTNNWDDYYIPLVELAAGVRK